MLPLSTIQTLIRLSDPRMNRDTSVAKPSCCLTDAVKLVVKRDPKLAWRLVEMHGQARRGLARLGLARHGAAWF